MAKGFLHYAPTIRVLDPTRSFVRIDCSNDHNCRHHLNVSISDSKDLTSLQVEGWRFLDWPARGGIHGFCPRCVEDLMQMERIPTEYATLRRAITR